MAVPSKVARHRLAQALVKVAYAHGEEMTFSQARALINSRVREGEAPDQILAELERLMKQPPVPLANRAKHTSGGTR